MDVGSKAVVAVGGMLMFMWMATALSVYQVKEENKALKIKLAEVDTQVGVNTIETKNLHKAIDYEYETQEIKNKALRERVSILDESVDSKDKRWSKIKKVREAIESTAPHSTPILELTKIASAIVDYSDQYDVPIPLIMAVSRRESFFTVKVTSQAGALGLMQVMPETGKEIAADIGKRRYSLWNIRDNIRFGTYYLRKMLYRFNEDLELAVRAYNCGPTYTEKVVAGEYQNYPDETVAYLEAVLEWKKKYEDLGL